ncbi:MAG: IclR family transcriptional regulator [Acidocella sp.]|nr:IclR family transcriptional regulator [Acidocella sp.]
MKETSRTAAEITIESESKTTAAPSMKAFGFLEAVAKAQRPLSILDLSVLLDIPQPTAHRIVHTLVTEGLLIREPGSRRYGPGERLTNLSLGLLSAAVRSAPRQAILRDLSEALRETCNFGVISGNDLVYLDRVEAAWPFGLRFEAGSRVPLHCTSMGKLFLSYMPAETRRRLLSTRPLHPYTANTITDPAALMRELDNIRKTGISTDNQEFLAGVVCVAVPIHTDNGTVVAAIAVSAPVARMPLQQGLQHIPHLRDAAAKIQDTLTSSKATKRAT